MKNLHSQEHFNVSRRDKKPVYHESLKQKRTFVWISGETKWTYERYNHGSAVTSENNSQVWVCMLQIDLWGCSAVWSFQFILNVSWVIRSESGSWNRPLPHPPIHHCVYQVSPRCLNWLHNSLLFKLITLEGHRSPCALICCQEGADFIQIGPAKENKLQLRFCRTKLFVNLNKSHHALLCSHAIFSCLFLVVDVSSDQV